MKKLWKPAAALLLCILLVFTLAGCQKAPNRTVREVYSAGSKDDKYSFDTVRQFDGHQYKLDHVDYRVLSEKKPKTAKLETISAEPDAYQNGDIFTNDGAVYRVEKVTVKSVPVDTDVEMTTDEPVSTMTADYKENGQTVNLAYRLLSDEWVKADDIPIQIVGYGGPYYDIGDIRLSAKDPLKDVKKQSKAVLTADGLDARVYRVTDAAWRGPTYEDAAGNTCRDMKVSCEKHVAHYRSTVYRYSILYSSAAEKPDRYQMEATATYTQDDSVYEKQVETVILCIVGIAAAVVLFILIMKWRRKDKPVAQIGDHYYSEDDF